jgi:hypothetical protein
MRSAAQKLRHLLRLLRTLTPTQMRRPALRSMPRIMPTLLRTLLPGLVTRHPLRMPPTDFRRSSAQMSAASPQSRVAVRVNQRRDYVSPVGASMYCSPHPAALHIAPAARLPDFCL